MSVSLPVHTDTADTPEAWADAWYVAYTKPSQEKTALEQLARQGYETYLPLYKKWPKVASKRGTAAAALKRALPADPPAATCGSGPNPLFEAMFPRYVFFKPSSANQSLSPARSTRGVCTLVSFGLGPAPVQAHLIDKIRALETLRNQTDLQSLTPFQPGTAVRLKGDQLQALQGLVIASSAQRITVLLEILGRPTAVHTQHEHLELV